jgi:hypothetical protein
MIAGVFTCLPRGIGILFSTLSVTDAPAFGLDDDSGVGS